MERKYRERLEQVCRVLRELPHEKKFSLSVWHRCGTVACAVEWAANDPWFKRRGLKLEEGLFSAVPAYKGFYTWDAIEAFFGVTGEEACRIFSNMGRMRNTRYDVIRRIEKFIKDAA